MVILAVTVAVSLLSPKGRALRALQNAERYAYRYTVLADDVPEEQRQAAAQRMDRWTSAAQQVSEARRDDLLEHKDRYSAIIREAHEARSAAEARRRSEHHPR